MVESRRKKVVTGLREGNVTRFNPETNVSVSK